MAALRTRLLHCSLAALITLAIGCGSGEEGPGGGGGADDGRPRIDRLEPAEGPIGSTVVIHGANFAPELSKNRVQFNRTDSTILEVDPQQKWVRTRVPNGATSGKVTMQVDLGDGFISIEGPVFTVNDHRPKPTLGSLSPNVVTEGFDSEKIVLNGSGFVESSRVLVNGVEVQARRLASTSMDFTLTPELAPTVGSYEIQVVNDPPGGGSSEKRTLKVLNGLRFVAAEAFDERVVLLFFDRPVGGTGRGSPGNPSFRITPELRIQDVARVSGHPNVLALETRRQGVGVDYEVEILTNGITSDEGGKMIGTRVQPFRSFRYPPVHVETFGSSGCGAAAFREPVSIHFAGETAYVTEASGNQVQLLDVAVAETKYGSFLGSDGSGLGFHDGAAVADGCPGGLPEDEEGLVAPSGAVAVDGSGGVYVSSTGSGEILYVDASGARSLFLVPEEGDDWTAPVVLGLHGGELYFAGDDDKLHLISTTSRASRSYGRPGAGFGHFSFGIDDGRIPQLAFHPEEDLIYLVEAGNHRIHRVQGLKGGGGVFSGVVGKGSSTFDRDIDPFPAPAPGTGVGEFTNPTGIVVLPDGSLLVADEANGGRLQRLRADGKFIEDLALDFLPGGMAIDPHGFLWITAPEDDRIHRFRL